jgi:acyl carrier protein
MNNREKYNEIFVSIFGVKEEQLDGTFNFNNIESWDSMTHLMLIGELEEIFDIMLETDDILHFGGYQNGMTILKKYGVDFAD